MPEMPFQIRTEICGMNMILDIEPDKAIKLIPTDDNEFRTKKATAKIFIRNQDGSRHSAEDILDYYLQESKKDLQDFIPKKEIDKAALTGKVEFNYVHPVGLEGVFHVATTKGNKSVKVLEIKTRYFVVPVRH